MTRKEQLHGGIRFSGGIEPELEDLAQLASVTLRDSGLVVERHNLLPDGAVRLVSSRALMDLKRTLLDGRVRLAITLRMADPQEVKSKQTQRILMLCLFRMLRVYPAHSVEWLSTETVLPAGQFMTVFGDLSPNTILGDTKPIRPARLGFEPVEETAHALSSRCEELSGANHHPYDPTQLDEIAQDDNNDIRRLATWGMTGVVTCLSGPVGLSMAAVNLLRGEDFRLNTQVLSLTGFLCVTSSTGVMAQIVSTIT
ncbi:MAG: hypothetical protein AB3N23_14475 [Paracoccaceae bacterium]